MLHEVEAMIEEIDIDQAPVETVQRQRSAQEVADDEQSVSGGRVRRHVDRELPLAAVSEHRKSQQFIARPSTPSIWKKAARIIKNILF